MGRYERRFPPAVFGTRLIVFAITLLGNSRRPPKRGRTEFLSNVASNHIQPRRVSTPATNAIGNQRGDAASVDMAPRDGATVVL